MDRRQLEGMKAALDSAARALEACYQKKKAKSLRRLSGGLDLAVPGPAGGAFVVSCCVVLL